MAPRHQPEEHFLTKQEWADQVDCNECHDTRLMKLERRDIERTVRDELSGKGWGWLSQVVTAILTAVLTALVMRYLFGK